MSSKVNILGVNIHLLNFPEAVKKFKTSRFVVTPNIDHLYNLRRNIDFKSAYEYADLVLCDSKILSFICRVRGIKLSQIAGSDYFPSVCQHYSNDEEIKIFLLGGDTPAHAETAARKINSKYGTKICGYYSPPFGFEKDVVQLQQIQDRIIASGATVLAVGLGSPKQEILIKRFIELDIPVKTYLAIGASINFESELLARSPRLIRIMGMEWFFRFLKEPGRLFKRYFINGPKVLFALILEKPTLK